MFTKETDIEVEIVKAGSGELVNRLKAEGGKSSADVIWSIAGELLEFNKDLLVPFKPENLAKVNEVNKTDGSWLPFAAIMNVFIVNTEKVSKADMPKSWADLTDPKYKTKISSARADKSGSAYMQLVTVLQAFGEEKGWETYNNLMKNYALSNSSGAVPRLVNDGEALVKGGSNLEDGKKFLNWMLSKEAQTIVSAQGRRSVRDDVKAEGNLPSLQDVKLINYDLKSAADNREKYKKKWNELLLNR